MCGCTFLHSRIGTWEPIGQVLFVLNEWFFQMEGICYVSVELKLYFLYGNNLGSLEFQVMRCARGACPSGTAVLEYALMVQPA